MRDGAAARFGLELGIIAELSSFFVGREVQRVNVIPISN